MFDSGLTLDVGPGQVNLTEWEPSAWYGIHVRSRCEVLAHHELCLRGFEVFLPTHPVKRHWTDRVKTLDQPLFPGYLFCRLARADRVRVLNAPGVARIVGVGVTPLPIPESEIRSVQTLIGSRAALVPWP